MRKNILLILASGKSSRFGGFPKAFCTVNDTYVVQRTVDFSCPYFDEIYLVINNEVYPQYKNVIKGCKTISIRTGQGDSHSFLRAVRLIKTEQDVEGITLCWGDTFYQDDAIFKRASEIRPDKSSVGISLSSIDPEPYAWYELDGDKIKASRFKDKDGVVKEGIHDQSVFVFNPEAICSQLEQYMDFLGINDEEDYINKEISKEMKLLNAFTYFYEKHFLPMKCLLVEAKTSYSFNTQEDLEAIRVKAVMKGTGKI